MKTDDPFLTFVLEQLSTGLPGVMPRSMFGGCGLYYGHTFFGIVYRGQLFLKVDDASRADYEARGMQPFRPSAKQTLKSYYEVPAEIVESRAELTAWAERAVQAAENAG